MEAEAKLAKLLDRYWSRNYWKAVRTKELQKKSYYLRLGHHRSSILL